MDLVYRVLGIAAGVMHASGNPPVGWVLFALVAFGTGRAGVELRYVLSNEDGPRTTTVAAMLQADDVAGQYVSLEGHLVQGVAYIDEVFHGNRKQIDASYHAMVDDDGVRGVLVRTKGVSRPHAEVRSGHVALVGMLMPMRPQLRDELALTDGLQRGVRFDDRFVLELGRRPGPLALWGTVVVMGGLALLALLVAGIKQSAVFRPEGHGPMPMAVTQPAQPIVVWASAVFFCAYLRRFLFVPAGLAHVDGRLLLGTNSGEASRFLGFERVPLASLWIVDLAEEGLPRFELGTQFYGFRRRPAVRIHHRSGGKASTTILACDDAKDLGAVAALLTSPLPVDGGRIRSIAPPAL